MRDYGTEVAGSRRGDRGVRMLAFLNNRGGIPARQRSHQQRAAVGIVVDDEKTEWMHHVPKTLTLRKRNVAGTKDKPSSPLPANSTRVADLRGNSHDQPAQKRAASGRAWRPC